MKTAKMFCCHFSFWRYKLGIKLGFAALAAEQRKYIKLKQDGVHPSSFAKVVVVKGAKHLFELHYTNGAIAHLRVNQFMQLEVVDTFFEGLIPSSEQSKPKPEEIMFEGGYEVQEIPPQSLFPPPEEHSTVEERFRNPKGVWDRAVASFLSL
jgi:hypothetical protein